MRHTFVLDEIIAICTTTRKNVNGKPDLTCYHLVNHILESAHRLGWSSSVWGKWSEQVGNLCKDGAAIAPHFLVLITSALRDPVKCPHPPNGDPDPLSEEDTWNARGPDTKLIDDKDYLRLAAHFGQGCLLATTDGKLERDVVKHELDVKYSFCVVPPELALERSRETCPGSP